MSDDDIISIIADAAAAGLRRPWQQRKRPARPIPTELLPPLRNLSDIAQLAPLLADAARPSWQRIRLLWAAAKRARHLPQAETADAFMALAAEAKLINKYAWTCADIRDSARNYGPEDVAHIIRWALRGMNPFEEGPLQ